LLIHFHHRLSHPKWTTCDGRISDLGDRSKR
jgi:hypothetical protein